MDTDTDTGTDMRPLIGFPTRGDIRTSEWGAPRFANNETYACAIAASGGTPVMIPSIPDVAALAPLYAVLDGLLLTGGPDVDPARYGQARHPKTDRGDPAMEQVEVYLARRALADGLPILGICRGIQMLNVVAGGTLYQDVGELFPGDIAHPADIQQRAFLAHRVRIDERTRLGRAVEVPEIEVNSLHHQAVCDVAPGFMVTAVAPDGLVEGIEHRDLPFAVAVQWHPEELYSIDETQARIFRAFVAAAATYHQRRAGS